VLVTDPITDSGVEELFQLGRHYLTYRSEGELLASIKDLLAHPDKARAIGMAARREVEARHTYDDRVQRLKAVVRDVRKNVRPAPSDYFAAFAAVNMPACALQSAGRGLVGMGVGTRWAVVNKVVGSALVAAGAAGQVASRALGRLRRQP
jgi:Glycosyl transferases group 1